MAFDPSEGRIRAALQPAGAEDRVTHSATWIQSRMQPGETLSFSHEGIQGGSLETGGQARPRAQGKRTADGGNLPVDLEPHGHAPYLALAQRRGATPVALGGGAFRHRLSPTQPNLDFRARRAQVQVWRDDTQGYQNYYGVGAGGFNFTAAPNGVWTGTFNLLGTRADYWGPSVQTVGTSTDPIVRGLHSHADMAAAADSDLVITVSAVPSGTAGFDFDILATRASDAPGAVVMPVKVGIWNRLEDSAGVLFGNRPSYVEIFWANSTGVTALDAWTVDAGVSTVWAASLPAVPLIAETMTDVYIDGVQLQASRMTGLGFSVAQSLAQLNSTIGDVWPEGVLVGGTRTTGWNITKNMVDMLSTHRLEAFEPFHLDVRMQTVVEIGASGFYYTLRAVSPRCFLTGRRATIPSGDVMVETYQVRAEPALVADGEGFIDDLTLDLTNALSSIG